MNLNQVIKSAWNSGVRDYRSGRVNSERTLQAVLYHYLLDNLPTDVKVLCEPLVIADGYGTLVPDLVLVSGNEIVAAVELKFVPHHFALFEEDLVKLRVYSSCDQRFPLTLTPDTGRYSDELFSVSSNCSLVFAAISRHDAAAVDEPTLRRHMKDYEAQFLPLLYGVAA